MKRAELEALSTAALQQVIVDAASVLADRVNGAARATAAPAVSGSLFTFGSASAGSSGSGTPGISNLFGPAGASTQPSEGSIFRPVAFQPRTGTDAAAASSGGVKLFGGTGGGLFGGILGATTPAATTDAVTGSTKNDKAAGDGEHADKAKGEADPDGDGDGPDGGEALNEEEVTFVAGWTPSITLEVCDSVETGEESEEPLYEQRSKLYRFRDGEWKERGLGTTRLLKDKVTGRVRYLLRQEKTGKVVANHYVIDHKPYCELLPNKDSDKIWVWTAQDIADGELAVEQFALKFGTSDLAKAFKEAFDDAKERNAKIFALENSAEQ